MFCPICKKEFASYNGLAGHRSPKRPKADGTRNPNPCLMSEEEKEQFRAEANQRRLKNNSAYMRRKREQERRASGKPKRVVYTPEERKVKRKEWRKRWLEKNPEKVKEYNKRNRTSVPPEKQREYSRRWRENNRWRVNQRKRLRYSRLTEQQFQAIFSIEDRPTIPLEVSVPRYLKPEVFGKSPSPREYKVLAEVSVHGSMKSAAACIGISEQTAKNHLTNLYSKLGVSSITMALSSLGWLKVPNVIPVHEEVA